MDDKKKAAAERAKGAYWVRVLYYPRENPLEIMQWWPRDSGPIDPAVVAALPAGSWVSFGGPDYDFRDDEIEIVSGPLTPPTGEAPKPTT